MSCSVIAVPYALMWVIGAVATSVASNVAGNAINEKYNDEMFLSDYNSNAFNSMVEEISEKHFVEKEFETPFTDKEILRKTLEEHGVKDIAEWENTIDGKVDGFKLTFTTKGEGEPYRLKVTCDESCNAESKVSDLSDEYALNVQEDAYMHLIEKLKENSMQIESEEVMEDNTIVLTVNID